MNIRIEKPFDVFDNLYLEFKKQYLGKHVKVKYIIQDKLIEKEGALEDISISGIVLKMERTIIALPYEIGIEIEKKQETSGLAEVLNK